MSVKEEEGRVKEDFTGEGIEGIGESEGVHRERKGRGDSVNGVESEREGGSCPANINKE